MQTYNMGNLPEMVLVVEVASPEICSCEVAGPGDVRDAERDRVGAWLTRSQSHGFNAEIKRECAGSL